MPVMDGPTMLAQLRKCPQTVNTPVVFVTARAQTREIEHFKSLGATGVIVKPFDPMTLAESVRCHLRSAELTALPTASDLDQRPGSLSRNESSRHFGRDASSLAAG